MKYIRLQGGNIFVILIIYKVSQMLRGMINSICSTPPPPINPTSWDGFTRGGVHPQVLARGVLFFMIKQKNIRDKMKYSNLSDNMIISKL
jgi:hypothetical protein